MKKKIIGGWFGPGSFSFRYKVDVLIHRVRNIWALGIDVKRRSKRLFGREKYSHELKKRRFLSLQTRGYRKFKRESNRRHCIPS